ncbi:unnamed protein product, partial [Polarella glacialis]
AIIADSGEFKNGCFRLIAVSAGSSYSKDLDITTGTTSACSNTRCPQCFEMKTSGPLALTLLNCHKSDFALMFSMTSNTLEKYNFINVGQHWATVTDGTNTYDVPPQGKAGSNMECYCSFGGLLSCDSTMSPMLRVGTDTALVDSDQCALLNSVSLTTIALDKEQDGAICNFRFCPNCFLFQSTSAAMDMTITNCGYMGKKDLSAEMTVFRFSNIGTNMVSISDGVNIWSLSPRSSGPSFAECTCTANLLYCSLPSISTVASPSPAVAGFPYDVRVGAQTTAGKLQFTNANTYIVHTSTNLLEVYMNTVRSLSFKNTGGTLHGTWSTDSATVSSDARLKRDIEPLGQTMSRLRRSSSKNNKNNNNNNSNNNNDKSLEEPPPIAESDEEDTMQWLLASLRPVSYTLINEKLGGGRRFGFIAQDLEKVLPEMVTQPTEAGDPKRVYMLDLIAVLTFGDLEALRQKVRDVLGEDAEAQEDLIVELSGRNLRSMLAELGHEVSKPKKSETGAKEITTARPEEGQAEPEASLETSHHVSPFMAAVSGPRESVGEDEVLRQEGQKNSKSRVPKDLVVSVDPEQTDDFLNICAWCGETRRLPFDLRSDFVCEDAGLSCRASSRAQVTASTGDEQPELFPNACAWCGETRHLPFALGDEFICRDVALECNESSAHRQACISVNVCAFCGCERHLPFDFGMDGFVCDFAGFECDYSTEEAKQRRDWMIEEVSDALGGETF